MPPQFVDRDAGAVSAQMFSLALVALVLGLGLRQRLGLAASRLRDWFNASAARGRAVGMVGGLSMVGLGVAPAATGRPK